MTDRPRPSAGRTAQRLTPTGLPQGERQRLEQQRRAAGIPLEVGPQPAPTLPTQAVRALSETPLARAAAPARQSFDALMDVDPARFRETFTPTPGAPMDTMGPLAAGQIEDRLAEVAARSNNRLGREVAERMKRLRQGT